MEEKRIERKLIKAVKNCGGMCLKFVSPSFDGVPDRIVLLPQGRIAFVETKATGEEMRPLQKYRKRQLERLGFLVFCLDNENDIGEIINEIRTV